MKKYRLQPQIDFPFSTRSFMNNLVIGEPYEHADALVACFPWCGGITSNTRCIPRSSRCK